MSRPEQPEIQQLQQRVAELELENAALRGLKMRDHHSEAAPKNVLQRLMNFDEAIDIARRQAESTQARAAELAKAHQALKQTIDLLATESDLDRFLGHVLKVIAEQFDAPLIQYWEHPEPDNISYLRLACQNGQILTAAELPHDCFVTGIEIPPELIGNEDLHTRKRHYVVEDMPADPIQQAIFSPLNFDLESWCTEYGIRKLLSFPLMRAEKTTGALLIYFPSGRHLNEQQIELAYALAQQVSLAIQLMQLVGNKQAEAIASEQEAAAQAKAAELARINDALQRTISRLATNLDLDAYLEYLLIEVAVEIGAYTNALFIYDETAHSLTMRAIVIDGAIVDIKTDPRLEIWRSPLPADISPAWNVMSEQGILLVNLDADQDSIWPSSAAWHDQMGHLSLMAVPLGFGDRAVGFMAPAFRARAEIFTEKIALSRALADQATLALELTRLADEAKQAAIVEERNRMARDIHDALAQSLTGVVMQLNAATEFLADQPQQTQACIIRAQDLAKQGLTEARRSVWLLYHSGLETCGLSDSLAQFIEQISTGTTVNITLQIKGNPYALDPPISMNLLRIAQELLTNALRHAQSPTVQLQITYLPQQIQLLVQDDGCGFDPQQPGSPGFGLIGMRARAKAINAQLQIHSIRGSGTETIVTVAIAPP